MRGLEKQILGIIILAVVILLAVIIVFLPTTAFTNNMNDKKDFENFCVYWSIHNYKDSVVKVNGVEVQVLEECSIALRSASVDQDLITACQKCCKKEIVC